MAETAKRFAIAGVAGCGASCVVHPLDVVRVNLQVDQSKKGGTRVYSGMFDCARKIASRGGVTSLWSGLTAGMFRQITYGMLNGALSAHRRCQAAGEQTLPCGKFLCGATAGKRVHVGSSERG